MWSVETATDAATFSRIVWAEEDGQDVQGRPTRKEKGRAKEGTVEAVEPQLEAWALLEKVCVDGDGQEYVAAARSARASVRVETELYDQGAVPPHFPVPDATAATQSGNDDLEERSRTTHASHPSATPVPRKGQTPTRREAHTQYSLVTRGQGEQNPRQVTTRTRPTTRIPRQQGLTRFHDNGSLMLQVDLTEVLTS
jgi:hypothetical protein